jgi:peptidoglycan hydrolase-like protein with peptidoglycan-binding domain
MQVRTGARCASGSLALAVAVVALVALAPAAAQAAKRSGEHARHSSVAPLTRLAGWSAGPVQRWTGYRRPGGSRRVREVQRRLDRLGYQAGPVDGLFGPRTERATRHFQARHAVRVDGVVGRHTLHALRRVDRRHTPVSAPRPAHPPRTAAPRARPTTSPPAATPVREPGRRPALPVTAVLIALGCLGAGAVAASFVRTRRQIRRLQRPGPAPGVRARAGTGPPPTRRRASLRKEQP